MADERDKKCRPINHPSLMPSWGCCMCPTLNGNQRQECKSCGHKRCDSPAVLMMPAQVSDGIVIARIELTKTDKSKTN